MMLMQTSLENITPLGVLAMTLLMFGQVAVSGFKSMRSNGRSDPMRDAARLTKDIHGIVTERFHGTPLVYQPGVQEAIKEMKNEIVQEIRKLTAAVKKNGGG